MYRGIVALVVAALLAGSPAQAQNQWVRIEDEEDDLRDLSGELFPGPAYVDLQAVELALADHTMEVAFVVGGDTSDMPAAVPTFDAAFDTDGDGTNDSRVTLVWSPSYDSLAESRWHSLVVDSSGWDVGEVDLASDSLTTRISAGALTDLDEVAMMAQASAASSDVVDSGFGPSYPRIWVDEVSRGVARMPSSWESEAEPFPIRSVVRLPDVAEQSDTLRAGSRADARNVGSSLRTFLSDHSHVADILGVRFGFKDSDFDACDQRLEGSADDIGHRLNRMDASATLSPCTQALAALYATYALTGESSVRALLDVYQGTLLASLNQDERASLETEFRMWKDLYIDEPST